MQGEEYGEPSPAQGSAWFGQWQFTSAFDGGNALVSSWTCNGRPAYFWNGKDTEAEALAKIRAELGVKVDTISVDIARDCHGEPRLQNPHAFWFYFGITPPPHCKSEVTICVRGIQQQRDLLAKCFRPWVIEPSYLKWRRIKDVADASCGSREASSAPRVWTVSWRHRFDGKQGMTRFAFSHPYGYGELQSWLGRLQHDFPYCEQSEQKAEEGTADGPEEAQQTGSEEAQQTASEGAQQAATPEVFYFIFREWHDVVMRAGKNIYLHREAIAYTPRGRRVEMLTITEAPEKGSSLPPEEMPASVVEALRSRQPDAPAQQPALRFPRPVVFFSGRVHPGETPGSFAVNGFLQWILSEDPRAALLRRRFVFKVCPMLNPDGVAWGHSRFNTVGFDLNRCYRNPVAEQHEGVFAVKETLLSWAAQDRLFFYMDCHGHMNKQGNFLFANHNGDKTWSSEDALLWNVAYAHAAQLNCPHLDIDTCEWNKNFDQPPPKKGKNREEEEAREGDDEATGRTESGRAQIGEACRLFHVYTLECSYTTGRTVRPVPDAPDLPPEAQANQSTQGYEMQGRKVLPPPYGPREWGAVGEALAVAILDLHCRNEHSRLLKGRPPKPFLPPSRDLANLLLDRLWDSLQARHAGKPPLRPSGEEPEQRGLRRRIFQVVHSPHVYVRGKPDKAGTAITMKKPGDKVAILEVRSDGWVRLCQSEMHKFTRKGVKEAYMLVDGTSMGLGVLLTDSGETCIVPDPAEEEAAVPACLAPSLEDVEFGRYPPEI